MITAAGRVSLVWVAVVAATLLISGCGGIGSAPENVKPATFPAGMQGVVRGGQQPVTGATVQLYAVGTSGDGSAATPLLSPAVMTDANGNFSITGLYKCPSASTLVYIVATGGNPGLGGTTNNGALALMAALGPCGNLTSSTFIFMDELTTVAAVYALAPYMTSATAVGSGASDQAGLASAFTLAAELVNTATGSAPGTGVPAGAVVPTAQLNLIADILAACVNSPGGTAGDGSSCGSLFTLTTPTTTPASTPATNTIAALVNLANNPTLNTTALYALASSTGPFQPTPASAPQDMVVSLTYPAGLTASTTSLNFGTLTTGFTSAAETVTITNNSAGTLTVSGIAIAGSAAGDFSEIGSCEPPLTPGASCLVQVTATPAATGLRSAYLEVAASGANSAVVALSAAGLTTATGNLQITPSSITFPSTAVNFTSAPIEVTLQNTGTTTVNFSGFSITGTSTGDFGQASNCGIPLPPGGSCTAQVTVTPTALGSRSAAFSVNSDAPGSPASVSLAATGINPSAGPANLSLSVLNYTIAGTTQDIQLENFGTGALTIRSISSSDPSFVVMGNNCGTSLPAQSLCTISVQSNGFSISYPAYTNAAYNGVLTVTDDAAAGPQTASLYSLNIEQFDGVNFASTPTGVPVTDLVGVSGGTHNIEADVSGTISGADAGDFSPSPAGCKGSGGEPMWQICSFTMTFTPSAAGVRTARLQSLEGNSVAAAGYIPLSGSTPNVPGAAFTVPKTLSVLATLNNRNQALGSSIFSIQNIGSTTLSFSSFPITSATPLQFAANGNCSSIAPGASCTVGVSYSASAAGSAMGTLTVQDAASGSTQTMAITATSQYAPLILNPQSLTFASQQVGTTSSAQTFTVSDDYLQPLGHALTAAVTSPSANYTVTGGSSCPASTTQLCTVSVAFNPTSAGTLYGGVQITDTVSGQVVYLGLTGAGAGTPVVLLSPGSLTFPLRSVGTTSIAQTVMLTNTGTAALNLGGISLVGANPGDYVIETNNCASSLATGANCSFGVSFSPTATGTRTASVQILSNAATTPDMVGLSGMGQ